MSELAARDLVTIGQGESARDIAVYEVTPVQMRQMLVRNSFPGEGADQEALWRYQVDQRLFEKEACSLTDLATYTRLPIEELESLPPSQLRKILAKAKELNPDFFDALERMAAARS